MSHDYYKLLGLSRSATQQEIKAAFRVAAKKYHPDVNRGKGAEGEAEAANHFKVIQAAYATLSNPSERRTYDMTNPRAGRVPQASSAEYEAYGGGGGGYAEWDARTAARRAAAAGAAAGAASKPHGAGYARTAKHSSSFGRGGIEENEEPYDYAAWNAAHFGPTSAEREQYTSQRLNEAKQTGFAGYNDPKASRGENWAHRRAARERIREWEEEFGGTSHGTSHGAWANDPSFGAGPSSSSSSSSSSSGGSSGAGAGFGYGTRPFGGASLGESETAHYRRYAAHFRAQKAAADRAWPFRLLFWGSVLGVVLYASKQLTKPPGAR